MQPGEALTPSLYLRPSKGKWPPAFTVRLILRLRNVKKKGLATIQNGSTSALLLNRYLRNSYEETCISLRWPTGSCSLSAKKNTSGQCSVWARFHLTLTLFLFGSETFLPGGVWPSRCINVQQVKVHTVSHTPPLTYWTAHSVELAWQICSIQPHKVVLLWSHDSDGRCFLFYIYHFFYSYWKTKQTHGERRTDVDMQRIYRQTKKSAAAFLHVCVRDLLFSHIHTGRVMCVGMKMMVALVTNTTVWVPWWGKTPPVIHCRCHFIPQMNPDSLTHRPKTSRVFPSHSLKILINNCVSTCLQKKKKKVTLISNSVEFPLTPTVRAARN